MRAESALFRYFPFYSVARNIMLFGWCLLDEHAVSRTDSRTAKNEMEKKKKTRTTKKRTEKRKKNKKIISFAVSVWHVFAIGMYCIRCFALFKTLNAERLNWLRRYVVHT